MKSSSKLIDLSMVNMSALTCNRVYLSVSDFLILQKLICIKVGSLVISLLCFIIESLTVIISHT